MADEQDFWARLTVLPDPSTNSEIYRYREVQKLSNDPRSWTEVPTGRVGHCKNIYGLSKGMIPDGSIVRITISERGAEFAYNISNSMWDYEKGVESKDA